MSRTKNLVLLAIVIVACAGISLYFNRPQSFAAGQSTDDAYVQADYTNVAPRISGIVETVAVRENQKVRKGDTLAVLDDRDLKIATEAAEAAVTTASADVEILKAQIEQRGSVIEQAQSSLSAANAVLQLARLSQKRSAELVSQHTVSQQNLDEANSQLATAIAKRDGAVAALKTARRQLDILKGQLDAARSKLVTAKVSLDDAKLRLSYTRITAPISGTVGEKSVRVGAYVQAGSSLLSIVPLAKIYISAHYLETQLANVRPGQSVRIKVDALPGRVFKGTVDSIGPASGVTYSAIAPQNATGNFTKVTQRLPVRIRIDKDQPGFHQLRVGMSVSPEIETK